MKFYRITTCDHVNDLSGEGAYLHGGRWNSKGTRILYTAESMALSMLEALAHVTMVNQKRGFCRLVLEIELDVRVETRIMGKTWFKEVLENELPPDFRNNPAPDALRVIGDQFIEEGKYLALKVPSVVVTDSFNYLLNPSHPQFATIVVIESQPVIFDQRLVK